MRPKHAFFLLLQYLLAIFGINCNKLVQVHEPISSVTAEQTFSTEANATAAMLGIYSYMSGSEGNESFSNLMTSYYLGRSADELTYETSGNESGDPFLINSLTAVYASNQVSGNFWQPAYYDIYQANAIISGVQASTGITSASKSQLIGEAEFIRAFTYFYLTNLFGDLPLVLSIDFNQTVLLAKSSQSTIYKQIVSDLIDAQNSLPVDFSLTDGQPIRANKWAATALLARVYLYTDSFANAAAQATAVINSGQFSLVPLPMVPEIPPNIVPDSDAFWANSSEAILQLQTAITYPYSTWEGNFFVPYDSTSSVNAWLTSQLLGAFESNDLRRLNWVDSTDFNGTYYYYPFKYKFMVGSAGSITENYTLLRFAEQYLIRAEAEANLGQSGAAISDLNVIRARAGLQPYLGPTDQQSVLNAIYHENRIEFFAEWGHRWFDLKRWRIAIDTLGEISYKGGIDSAQLLYPIPLGEIQVDPNLTQNPGYQP